MNEVKVARALDHIRQGYAQEGMNLLREEFMLNPTDWKIHYHTGIAWRIIGDFDKAIHSYKQAVNFCPDNFMNHYGLGIAYQLKNDFPNALQSLIQSHQLDKTSVEVLTSLGMTYKKIGDIDKAIEVYNFAVQTLMGNIMTELENEGMAPTNLSPDENSAIVNMDIFQLVPLKLKEDNLYCTLQNNIGVCHAQLGQFEQAKKAFREAITFTPNGLEYDSPKIALRQLEEDDYI
jgi:tetratricopeptide (TPR) repeat protein